MRRWAGFVLSRPGMTRLYGFGLSMGAAILIQTLPTEPRFRALVADCPFATCKVGLLACQRTRRTDPRLRQARRPTIRRPIYHSRQLHALNPGATVLWEVEGADHGGAMRIEPNLYRRRVVEWFGGHP